MSLIHESKFFFYHMSIGWDYGIAHQNIKFLNLFYIIDEYSGPV